MPEADNFELACTASSVMPTTTGGVAHFWSHPENLATAPRTVDNFRALFEEVERLRRDGSIVVQTQRDYCDALGRRDA